MEKVFWGACLLLVMTQQGQAKTVKEKLKNYIKTCESSKEAEACYRAGSILHDPTEKGIKMDRPKAMTYLNIACQKKHGKACYIAGFLTEIGYGKVKPDIQAGHKLYFKSCEYDKQECGQLASFLADGESGFKQDPKLAIEYGTMACDAGYSLGCHVIAGLYGKWGPKGYKNQPKKEQEWRQKTLKASMKGCKAKNPDACSAVADKYIKGEDGIQKDVKTGLEFLEKSCKFELKIDHDHHHFGAYACRKLAEHYKKGLEGIPPSKEKFQFWAKKACANGITSYCEK